MAPEKIQGCFLLTGSSFPFFKNTVVTDVFPFHLMEMERKVANLYGENTLVSQK
jgi:hypothetical protein